MANYSELLNDINAAIYENNDQEIDALEVRAILREMVTSLGSGFLFKGIATPSSPSGTGTYEPDQNVFYLATTAGTYTYLGGLVVAAGEVAFLCFDGTWTKKSSALLSTGSIVDNLTTNDATKALSAKQGKVLSEAGAATAAEVSALGHEVDDLEDEMAGIADSYTSPNLFDKAAMVDGYIDSTGGIQAHTGAKASATIPVQPNHYYLLTGRTLLYGTCTIRCLTSALQPIKVLAAYSGTEWSNYRLPNIDASAYVVNGEFKTPATAAYVQFQVVYESGNGSPDDVMLTDLGNSYVADPPTPEYEPYGSTYTIKESALPETVADLLAESGAKFALLDEVAGQTPSRNLFDKSNLIADRYILDSTGGDTSYAGAIISSPVPVTPGHYYMLTGRNPNGTFAIRCLDVSGNPMKVLIASTGTQYTNYQLPKEDGSGAQLNGEFKVPAGAVSVQFTIKLDTGSPDNVMLLDLGDTYVANPTTYGYIPFGDQYFVKAVNQKDNPLYGKSVIFTGDSICNATTDFAGGGGWAKRIGDKNNMLWVNHGVSGGTITSKSVTGSPFTISETPWGSGADYIILEGGTNDADIIGSILNGATPANFGSYDETDYTTAFSNNKFCQAVEKMLKDVISSFPSARVGFIIAMKMGVTTSGYSAETNNRRAYFETIIKICKKWGVPVLNLWDECTMNPCLASHYTPGQTYLYVDGQHPTGNGYDLISPIIEEWMKTL